MFNQLCELLAEIGRLRNLRVLDASDNELTEIPASLGLLEHLQVVGVRRNYISPHGPISFPDTPESICAAIPPARRRLILPASNRFRIEF